jgi:hypothetical protein
MGNAAREKRAARNARSRSLVADKRRFLETPVPGAKAPRATTDAMQGTIYSGTVHDPPRDPLRPGFDQSKLGGVIQVGELTGAPIFHLTLEERATCPRSCDHWTTCYGNGMQLAKRWRHGRELETAIDHQLAGLMGRHPKIMVRLHTLGDFYSPAYVRRWRGWLERYPGLHVFGFTARMDGPIAEEIERTRNDYRGRFMVRWSGHAGRMGSFTIEFPTARKRLGDALVCLEQREQMDGPSSRHCGTCGWCWSTEACIVFVEH